MAVEMAVGMRARRRTIEKKKNERKRNNETEKRMVRMNNKSLKRKIPILTNIVGLKNKKRQQSIWKKEGNDRKKTNMEILMVKKVMAGKKDVLVERMILILEKVWSPREGGEGGDWKKQTRLYLLIRAG